MLGLWGVVKTGDTRLIFPAALAIDSLVLFVDCEIALGDSTATAPRQIQGYTSCH
jgi:hypothetical protein